MKHIEPFLQFKNYFRFYISTFGCVIRPCNWQKTSRTCKQGNISPFIFILRLFTPFWVNNCG